MEEKREREREGGRGSDKFTYFCLATSSIALEGRIGEGCV